MAHPPKSLRSLRDLGVFEITWPDGNSYQLPFQFLRGRCPCANCVDEMTGVRTLDLKSVPTNVRPTSIGFSGNYALKIDWSDNHNSGIYTWNRLMELSRAENR